MPHLAANFCAEAGYFPCHPPRAPRQKLRYFTQPRPKGKLNPYSLPEILSLASTFPTNTPKKFIAIEMRNTET